MIWHRSLLCEASGDCAPFLNFCVHLFKVKSFVSLTRHGQDGVSPCFGIIFHPEIDRHAPITRLLSGHFVNEFFFSRLDFGSPLFFWHGLRRLRKQPVNSITVPESMELRALMSGAARKLEPNGIAALIFQPRFAPIGIDFFSALIKIFRAHMERLMNVAQVVREEN